MDAQAVRAQLERILASASFSEAERARNFLRFVVENALTGRVDSIKESVIAVEVLGRPPSFDSRTDPIVRVEAGRLRSRLSSYYQSEGAADPILIDLPKGGYVPRFEERARDAEVPPMPSKRRFGCAPSNERPAYASIRRCDPAHSRARLSTPAFTFVFTRSPEACLLSCTWASLWLAVISPAFTFVLIFMT